MYFFFLGYFTVINIVILSLKQYKLVEIVSRLMTLSIYILHINMCILGVKIIGVGVPYIS